MRQWLSVGLLVGHTVRCEPTSSLVVQLIAGTANAGPKDHIMEVVFINLSVDAM
jgi:hypothetical protein